MADEGTITIGGLPSTSSISSSDLLHINKDGVDFSLTASAVIEQFTGTSANKLAIKTESSSVRTLTKADNASYINCVYKGQTSITIPSQRTVDWPDGTIIYVRNDGGSVLFSNESGVQLNQASSGGALTEFSQVGALVRRQADIWDLVTGGNGRTVNKEFTAQSSTLGYVLGFVNKSQWMDIYGTNSNVVVTCPDDSTSDLGPQFVHMITNYTIHPVTINAESGVTLEAPAGGSLVIPPNATAGIKKAHWAPNTYIVFGSTEAP